MTRFLKAFLGLFDLLDVVLLFALGLIAAGAFLLWGSGWACLILGALLLILLVVGIPAGRKS